MTGVLDYPNSAESFTIRRITEDDGDILADIYENTPDTGDLGTAPQFKIDPYVAHSAAYPDTETPGFLAVAPDGSPAGAGFVNLTHVRAGGDIKPAAYLTGLAVHEEYRGQGLAKRLAAERINHAHSTHDPDCIIYTSIQSGNEPSKAVAKTWADEFLYETAQTALQPRDDEPATDDYTIRPASETEYDTIVERVNDFYDRAEFFRPYTTELLDAWMDVSPIDEPVLDYYVATKDNEIVAGALVEDVHKLVWTKIEDLPPQLKDADELPPTIPDSREMRMTGVVDHWFTDGHEDAAEALIETVRARPESGNRIGVSADPDSPATAVIDTDGFMRKTHLAVRGLDEPVEEAFLTAIR